ncbi:unnamed protein product [Symbiodinium sp. CCMP2456]|nr:unnamed protein product [Symbiodinium sp. CCMP2456]
MAGALETSLRPTPQRTQKPTAAQCTARLFNKSRKSKPKLGASKEESYLKPQMLDQDGFEPSASEARWQLLRQIQLSRSDKKEEENYEQGATESPAAVSLAADADAVYAAKIHALPRVVREHSVMSNGAAVDPNIGAGKVSRFARRLLDQIRLSRLEQGAAQQLQAAQPTAQFAADAMTSQEEFGLPRQEVDVARQEHAVPRCDLEEIFTDRDYLRYLISQTGMLRTGQRAVAVAFSGIGSGRKCQCEKTGVAVEGKYKEQTGQHRRHVGLECGSRVVSRSTCQLRYSLCGKAADEPDCRAMQELRCPGFDVLDVWMLGVLDVLLSILRKQMPSVFDAALRSKSAIGVAALWQYLAVISCSKLNAFRRGLEVSHDWSASRYYTTAFIRDSDCREDDSGAVIDITSDPETPVKKVLRCAEVPTPPPLPARRSATFSHLPPQEVAAPRSRQSSLLLWAQSGDGTSKRPRRLTAQEAIARRRERRERNADLRSGDRPLPPPVVGYDAGIERLCVKTEVEGVDVQFPVQPLDAQRLVMAAAMRAMREQSVAFVESPTGTGKTLALLSASLAYQHFQQKSAEAVSTSESNAHVPRVVWIARTHDQLQHAVAELRRVPYRPLEALRISRERFCLHPFVQAAQDKSTACEMATMTRNGSALGGGISGCEHLDNAEAIGYPTIKEHRSKFEAGGKLAVYDIEDLVKDGHETRTCPYHAALDLTAEGAGLVLATYPQLLDPCVRETSSFSTVLQDAIVVIDEAHNIPQAARDAATFRGTLSDLHLLISKLQGLAQATAEREAVDLAERVCWAVTRLYEWLKVASDTPAKQAVVCLAELKSGELRDTGGKGCLALVTHVAGLESAKEVDRLVRLLRVLRRRFIEHGLEGWAVRSSAVNEMDLFLRKMVLVLEEGGRGGYALILKKATTGSPSLAMVSLSGAVAFQAAAHACHSVILASGTLAPFKLLQRELGVGQGSQYEFFARSPVTVEVGQSEGIGSRLRVLALGSVDGQRLSSTRSFRAQQLDKYLDGIGTVVRILLPAVPNGKLFFFPSHEQLQDAIRHWRHCGLLERGKGGAESLCGVPAMVEASGLSSEASAELVARYRTAARDAAGAVLLAVMRGRCAEGADFKDEAARAVVVVGVPFPSLETEVVLKMEYERENKDAWYQAEAYRSVSQAAGRLLRHQADYGSLLLLDSRFAAEGPPTQLSGWLQRELRSQRPLGRGARGEVTSRSLEDVSEDLSTFFLRNESAVEVKKSSMCCHPRSSAQALSWPDKQEIQVASRHCSR